MITMTNLECAMALLEKHREARMWSDLAVAVDVLGMFNIDCHGEFPALVLYAPVPVVEPVAHVENAVVPLSDHDGA